MGTDRASSSSSSSSSRPKCCEICFETYDNLDNEAMQLFCCSKLLCTLCVKGILSEQASRCPWCYRKWIERGFYQKSKLISLETFSLRDDGSVDDQDNSNPYHIVTAASGEIKKEYESIREKALSELRHQLLIDEEIAKRLFEDEQRALEKKRQEEEADSAFAMQLSQNDNDASQPTIKCRPVPSQNAKNGGGKISGQKTLFEFVTKIPVALSPKCAVAVTAGNSSSSSSKFWTCTACTFVNERNRFTEVCEMCASSSSSSSSSKRMRVDDNKENCLL